MKSIMAVALLVSSVSAFSASVKITSFNYIRTSPNMTAPLAELCGSVEGATTSPSFVNVKVDPTTGRPANYNTFAGADGKFCVAVITYRGTADVSMVGEKSVVTAKAE